MPGDSEATIVLVRDGIEVGSWALARRQPCDLVLVDELARWRLAARGMGCGIQLRNASPRLLELLELVGLLELLAGQSGGIEAGG